MARSSALYLLIVLLFAVVYMGTILFAGAVWLPYLLAAGVILFIVRIVRGDD